MDELSIFERYNKVLDKVFSKPPMDTGRVIQDIMKDYPV